MTKSNSSEERQGKMAEIKARGLIQSSRKQNGNRSGKSDSNISGNSSASPALSTFKKELEGKFIEEFREIMWKEDAFIELSEVMDANSKALKLLMDEIDKLKEQYYLGASNNPDMAMLYKNETL